MPLTHIKVAKDLQELTLHGTKEFPVALYETIMRLESMDFLPLHWHKEIQFVFIKMDVHSIEWGRTFCIEARRGTLY